MGNRLTEKQEQAAGAEALATLQELDALHTKREEEEAREARLARTRSATAQRIILEAADRMRGINLPGDEARTGQEAPTYDRAPPGKTVDQMSLEAQELTLLAVEGLGAHMRAQFARIEEGTPAYREASKILGVLSVTANQIRRWIDERMEREKGEGAGT